MVIAALPLHPASAAFCQKIARLPLTDLDKLEQVRTGYDRLLIGSASRNVFAGTVVPVAVNHDGRCVACRLYTPQSSAECLPVVLYFHGGGHVQGTLNGYDPFCRALSEASGAAVLSVGYRLAPEHSFPIPHEDCYSVIRWVLDGAGAGLGISGNSVALAGDSAGGHLAIVTSLLARDDGIASRIAFVLALCPVTDYRPASREKAEAPSSFVNYADGYLLTANKMMWFGEKFIGEDVDARSRKHVSPVTADLTGLPPMMVVTAGYDPLRDEGESFAAKAAAAGSPVEHFCQEDEFHVWWMFGAVLPQASRTIQYFGDLLAHGFGLRPTSRL